MTPDFIAQLCMAGLLVWAATPQARGLFRDCMDMNVERIDREERNAAEAQAWLAMMRDGK